MRQWAAVEAGDPRALTFVVMASPEVCTPPHCGKGMRASLHHPTYSPGGGTTAHSVLTIPQHTGAHHPI
jgi:hypothetical protein